MRRWERRRPAGMAQAGGTIPYSEVKEPALVGLPECRRPSACPVTESTPGKLMQTGVCTAVK